MLPRRIRVQVRLYIGRRLKFFAPIQTSGIELFSPDLNGILERSAADEIKIFEVVDNDYWNTDREIGKQRERLTMVAEFCAQHYPGDFIEIGAYEGRTTRRLAQIARKYNRRVIAVDPWKFGDEEASESRYNLFLQHIHPYSDIVDVVRESSLAGSTLSFVSKRVVCFAYIDGLHTYHACLSDILMVRHTMGIIGVDDVLEHNVYYFDGEVVCAFVRGARLTSRTAVHHPLCNEGYLLPQVSMEGKRAEAKSSSKRSRLAA